MRVRYTVIVSIALSSRFQGYEKGSWLCFFCAHTVFRSLSGARAPDLAGTSIRPLLRPPKFLLIFLLCSFISRTSKRFDCDREGPPRNESPQRGQSQRPSDPSIDLY